MTSGWDITICWAFLTEMNLPEPLSRPTLRVAIVVPLAIQAASGCVSGSLSEGCPIRVVVGDAPPH